MARLSLWVLVATIAVALGFLAPVPGAIPLGCSGPAEQWGGPDGPSAAEAPAACCLPSVEGCSPRLCAGSESDRPDAKGRPAVADCRAAVANGDSCTGIAGRSCRHDGGSDVSADCVCVFCHCGVGTLAPPLSIDPPRVESRRLPAIVAALSSIEDQPLSPPPENRVSLS